MDKTGHGHGQPIDGMTVWYKRSLGKFPFMTKICLVHKFVNSFLYSFLKIYKSCDWWICGSGVESDCRIGSIGLSVHGGRITPQPPTDPSQCIKHHTADYTLHTAYETLHNTHCPTGPSQCIAQRYIANYTLHTACNAVTQWKHCEANPLMLSVLWFGLPRNVQQIWAFLIETILDSSG